MIYTTNAVQALHRSLRKIIKTRGSFPNDHAALKLLNPASKNAGLRWRRGVEWTTATGQFVIVQRALSKNNATIRATANVLSRLMVWPAPSAAATRPWGLTACCNQANEPTMPQKTASLTCAANRGGIRRGIRKRYKLSPLTRGHARVG